MKKGLHTREKVHRPSAVSGFLAFLRSADFAALAGISMGWGPLQPGGPYP